MGERDVIKIPPCKRNWKIDKNILYRFPERFDTPAATRDVFTPNSAWTSSHYAPQRVAPVTAPAASPAMTLRHLDGSIVLVQPSYSTPVRNGWDPPSNGWETHPRGNKVVNPGLGMEFRVAKNADDNNVNHYAG